MGECLITRRGGEAYELPVLDENYPEDVTLTVIKGNTVSATFSAVFVTHGKPAEYTYQWYVDGAAVEGANSSLFTMTGLGETVNQSVYCEITNKAGTVTTRVATLKVTQYYTPVLNASYPANVTLNDGSTTSATFKVQIDTAGNPASYTYQWYVNGTAVSGATSATYTRTGLITKGTYTVYCKVTNAAGTVQSRTATLTVSHTILYINGNKCTANSGGWSFDKSMSSDGYDMASYTDGSASITITLKSLRTSITARTTKTVNLNNFSKLNFNISSNTLNKSCYIAASSKEVIPQYPEAYKEITKGTTGVVSVSISSLTNSLYLGIFAWLSYNASTSHGGSVTFNRVWLT